MSCDNNLIARRNADFRVTFSPASDDFTFADLQPELSIRRDTTQLLLVSGTVTPNGSNFIIAGDSAVATIKEADLLLLDGTGSDLNSDDLHYDLVMTDATGFRNWVMGGAFILAGLNDSDNCGSSCGSVEIALGGQCFLINVDGGNLGPASSVGLAELNQAVGEAKQAADDAEAAALAAVQVATLLSSTEQEARSISVSTSIMAIRTSGYSTRGDGGAALYARSLVEPSHAGKFRSADGAWWELAADFATLEMFGGRADNGGTDNYQPWRDAIYWAYLKGRQVVLINQGTYRFLRRPAQSPAPIEYPADIAFANPFVRMLVENGNDAEGVFILASDVKIRGGIISVFADSAITNGTGHCGTCITIQNWFVDPRLPEPNLCKNISIRDMVLTRESGSRTGHAISIMSRVSHVDIENVDFIGAGPGNSTGSHGNAVLTHWGAWTNGVSTTQLPFDAKAVSFTAGDTLTGSVSGAKSYIVDVDDSGSTGILYLKNVVGTYQNDEIIADTSGGLATVDGVASQGLRQAPFPPGRYSFHPNNVRIKNIRLRNTGRLIACSSSYSIDVDGVDIRGPVQGNQLVDLPVGDESDTFAHPDDRGRVYDGFSFRNIRGVGLTGTGANAVTAIDCSGYSTSKQTDAALAAYAGPSYAGEPFNKVILRYRQPEWKNAEFNNFTFDYGPANPPSSTVVQRMIWIRNVRGQMTFKNFNMTARENAIRLGVPDPVILGLTMANNIGNFTFEGVKSNAAAVVDRTDTASFIDSEWGNRTNLASSATVLLTGARPTVTTTANALIGATQIQVPAVTGTNVCIGDRLSYAGGIVYATDFVINGGGITTISVTPLPVAAPSGTVFTIDHRNRNISFDNCTIRSGARGFDVSNSVGTRVNGGEVCDSGQYGLLVNTGGDVLANGVLFNNGGQRRAAGESGLATRDIALMSGVFSGRNLRFEDSAWVAVNYLVSATAVSAVLKDSIFAGSPITSYVSVAALSNGQPTVFEDNITAGGIPVTYAGDKISDADTLPRVYVAGDSRGAQCSSEGRTRTQAWMWHLQQSTGGRFNFQPEYNIAVGGHTTEQMLADVGMLLNQPPSIVFAICSTNDRANGWPAQRSIDAMSAWQQRVVAHGHTVVWIAETPRGSAENTTYRLPAAQRGPHLQVRNWQLAQASKLNVYVADSWPLLANINATALDARDGLFYDGLHPGPRAAKIIADAIYPIINTIIPPMPRLVEGLGNTWSVDNPTGSLNANPVLAGTGGTAGANTTGTVATSWTTTAGSGISAVCSKGTNAEGYNYQRMVITGAPTGSNPGTSPVDPTNFSAVLSVPVNNISAGDIVEGTGQFTVSGVSGVRSISLYISITTASGTTTYCSGEPNAARSVPNLEMPNENITNGILVIPRFVVPSGVISASISAMIVGAPNAAGFSDVPITCTADFTRIAARKVLY